MKLYIYNNRHIQHQVIDIEKNGYIVLENELSKFIWKKYFQYNKLDEIESTINYVKLDKFLSKEFKMEFDVIVGNPPYQKKVGPNKTQAIWHKIVEKSIKQLKDGGTMTMIHPDAWRSPVGIYEPIKKLLLSKTIVSLEMFDESQGMKTFGAATPYDVYTLINEPNLDNKKTRIVGSDSVVIEKDLTNMDYIPNGSFEQFDKLIAKPNEERVEVLYSSSEYEIRNKYMSLEKGGGFKYPCVYTTTKDGTINFWYSNVKKEHFGVPKVVWSNGMAPSVVIDKEGQYGLTQFAYAIVDKPENLEMIQKAMESEKFLELMQNSQGKNQKYNRQVISLFRKDFWKEFV